MTGQGK